ncbi:Rieske (2Fe-2S) region [Calothrix sp. NIES-4071]|nr:Rieske (2Fe-2S) region [Calothrix sp. NIES-4071]BAZ57885.1 Rieske (2Fe-2S) region [Calothrix sp. NIES-4105]
MYRFPFPAFPNGWFRVAFSDELPPKAIKTLHYFGKDLVLFRTEDGKPHVFDAHCPHLGAHLGFGGRVEGNNLRCPFHGWCFDSHGQCVEVPYATTKVTPKTKMQSWHTREVNGTIMIYHHLQGEAPTWEIPEMPEYSSPDWLVLKRTCWKMRSHPQELAENGLDIAHMPYVHEQAMLEINSQAVEIEGIKLIHRMYPKYQMYFGTKKLGAKVDCSHDIVYYGLGHLSNYVRVQKKIDIGLVIVFFPTPIDEEYIEVHGVFIMKKVWTKTVTKILAIKMIQNFELTINQDIPIWENKIYRHEPILCGGDGSIKQFRHWASQFYSVTLVP